MEFTVRLAMFVLRFILKLLQPIYWFVNYHRQKELPAIKNPLLLLSAKEIAKKIRNREISSEAVVEAYIERIKAVNPQINAVIENRFNEAMKEARACDKKFEAGEINVHTLERDQPLYGVPFSVKEACSLKGYSYTGCTLVRKDEKSFEDGEAVKLMKLAGAIPLCVTNTPEMCAGFDSSNLIYGTTNNPYDTRRIAAGSSGGEGALGGAGAIPIGIGSDIAGSIRVPCLFNGIFGHKASADVVPVKGHYPMSPSEVFQKYLAIGPMARHSEDLLLAMKILSKNFKEKLQLEKSVDINNLKIFYMEKFPNSPGEIPVSRDIRNSIKKAVQFLKKHVSSVECPKIDELKDIYEISIAMFFCVEDVPRILLNPDDPKKEKNPFIELGKAIFGLSQHTKNTILMSVFTETRGLMLQSKLSYYREREIKIQTKFENLLGTNGILIIPSYPTAALLRNQAFLNFSGACYSILFNILGFPATQVPMGLNEQGLPIGFQIIANKNQDRLCLAVAQELEKEFGGWIPPNSS